MCPNFAKKFLILGTWVRHAKHDSCRPQMLYKGLVLLLQMPKGSLCVQMRWEWAVPVLLSDDLGRKCIGDENFSSFTERNLQEGLDIQASVADLLHHVIPAARVWPRPACPCPSVPRGSSRTPPDSSWAPTVAPAAWACVQLAQALRGDRGVVGTRRRLVSEGLLEALLPDQGPRARHCRGWDVLQGGGRREGGVPKTERRRRRTKKRWIEQGRHPS